MFGDIGESKSHHNYHIIICHGVAQLARLQAMLNALGVSGKSVSITVALRNENGLAEVTQLIILNRESDGSFYVLALGVIASLYEKWRCNLPKIYPYYAVKCRLLDPTLTTRARLKLKLSWFLEFHQIESFMPTPVK